MRTSLPKWARSSPSALIQVRRKSLPLRGHILLHHIHKDIASTTTAHRDPQLYEIRRHATPSATHTSNDTSLPNDALLLNDASLPKGTTRGYIDAIASVLSPLWYPIVCMVSSQSPITARIGALIAIDTAVCVQATPSFCHPS